jgi:eukaryotic-like serine/threonine-protein kinase
LVSIPFERLEGKYEILEKMREGGMGAVYKVRHRLLDEVRVIKVMRPQLAQDDVLRQRFLREAKTAVRLRHPNLAQIFDFAIDDEDTAFIVMEFIDGLSLQDLLKVVSRPDLGLVLEIAAQTLDVLSYLHRKGIVHRDIAPDNLLLTRDDEGRPQVKVIDLGIAKGPELGSGLTRTGTFVGKIRYCSPEHFQTQQGPRIDGRSDIYSFAIVLYELATGVYPIRGGSTSALISGHLIQPPLPFAKSDPDGHVPDDLRQVILRSLEKKPEDRPQTAEELHRAVSEIQERFPLADSEIESIFAVPLLKPAATPGRGSTQDNIDRNFLLTPTPPPVSAVEPMPALPPQPPPRPHQTAGGPAAAPGVTIPEDRLRQQVKALLLGAEKLAQLGQLDEAKLQLHTALELDPRNREGKRLLATIEAADRARQEEIAKAALEVRALIAAGSFDPAQERLEEAIAQLGGAPELRDLQAEVDDGRESAREAAALKAQRAAERLATAHKLMDEESFEDAIEALHQVIESDPTSAEPRIVLAEAQRLLEEQGAARLKEQEIADTCAAIALNIERGELAEAERALTIARKLYGERPQFEPFVAGLEEARREARRREAADLIAAGRPTEALELLAELRDESGDDERLAALVEAANEALRRQEEAARRARRIETAVRGIDNLILAGRFETAYRTIDTTVTEVGSFDQATQLRKRIEREVAERRKREAHAWTLLGRARSLAEKGKFDAAESALDEARAFETELPEVHDLLEETARGIRQLADEHKRKQVLTEAVTSISRCIDRGAIDEALREIEVAERLCGPQKDFAALRARVDEVVRSQRQARVEALLREALGKQASFHEVISRLEEALTLDPTNARVQRLLTETQTALTRYEQERRAAAVAEVMGEVDALILAGDFESALRRTDQAVEKLGEFREARTLRQRLQAATASRK